MTTSTKRLLFWEFGCVSAEMASVGVGLWFGLGMKNWEAANAIMLGVVVVSLLVRTRHYSSCGRDMGC